MQYQDRCFYNENNRTCYRYRAKPNFKQQHQQRQQEKILYITVCLTVRLDVSRGTKTDCVLWTMVSWAELSIIWNMHYISSIVLRLYTDTWTAGCIIISKGTCVLDTIFFLTSRLNIVLNYTTACNDKGQWCFSSNRSRLCGAIG